MDYQPLASAPEADLKQRVPATIGIVVIGRNEGARLLKCLDVLSELRERVIYVDSGSTDGSAEKAGGSGVHVLALDACTPFTAARARNEGFKRLRELVPAVTLVQFVDGDCELLNGWLEKAATFLEQNSEVGAVCGRLRERYPERTIYNMLCDCEWDAPVGDAKACGGIAMMRVSAFESVNGFRSDLIAGEEPELCVRMRGQGWRIRRLGEDMALHDAAMSRFGQWWRRTLRGGYAFAQGVALHGASPERCGVRESRSAWLWGLGMPVGIVTLSAWLGAWAIGLWLIYPLQVIRLAARGGRSARDNWWRAGFLVLGKFPEMLGQLKFLYHRYLGVRPRPIEYK